jgi:retron-type reverse transcriptase
MILKPNGGQRPISIPKFTDKIVQEAIKIVIEPIFEELFFDRSYGFTPNRDCLKTIQRVKMEFQAVK